MKLDIPQDSSDIGKAQHNAAYLDFLVKIGLAFEYFLEPEKSIYIFKRRDEIIV